MDFFLTRKRYSTLYSTSSLAEAKHILNMSFSTTSKHLYVVNISIAYADA